MMYGQNNIKFFVKIKGRQLESPIKYGTGGDLNSLA